MSIKPIDLVAVSFVTAVAGYVYGCIALTNYYKKLIRTSHTSDDPAEAEKAAKTLNRLLHLKVQYPDEN